PVDRSHRALPGGHVQQRLPLGHARGGEHIGGEGGLRQVGGEQPAVDPAVGVEPLEGGQRQALRDGGDLVPGGDVVQDIGRCGGRGHLSRQGGGGRRGRQGRRQHRD